MTLRQRQRRQIAPRRRRRRRRRRPAARAPAPRSEKPSARQQSPGNRHPFKFKFNFGLPAQPPWGWVGAERSFSRAVGRLCLLDAQTLLQWHRIAATQWHGRSWAARCAAWSGVCSKCNLHRESQARKASRQEPSARVLGSTTAALCSLQSHGSCLRRRPLTGVPGAVMPEGVESPTATGAPATRLLLRRGKREARQASSGSGEQGPSIYSLRPATAGARLVADRPRCRRAQSAYAQENLPLGAVIAG